VAIVGLGSTNLTVDGNKPVNYSRIFHITSGKVVTISGLTITNGDSSFAGFGGGIWNDHGVLTISNCTVSGNYAAASDSFGGGIFNDGSFVAGQTNTTLVIFNCTINDNYSSYAGGIYNLGGGNGGPGVGGNATVQVFNSTLSGNNGFHGGGGIYNESKLGWLGTSATVQLNHCTVKGNFCTYGIGAGIFNIGSQGGAAAVQINDSSVDENGPYFWVGGIENQASGLNCVVYEHVDGQDICVLQIAASATLTISNSSVARNSGGGIRSHGEQGAAALVKIVGSNINSNSASYQNPCGGIYNYSQSTLTLDGCSVSGNIGSGAIQNGGGTVKILNSTLSGNSANGAGGCIFNTSESSSAVSGGTVSITNSTLSGNSALNVNSCNCGGVGGAVYNDRGSSLRMMNCTLSGNSAESSVGGIYNTYGATLEMGNTILNTGVSGSSITNISATVISDGYNLSSDGGGGVLTNATDLINTNPMLGPLANNGGSTFTHGLLPGSPAINAGNPGFASPPDFDQRGSSHPRVVGGRIDIGAFEGQLQTAAALLSSPVYLLGNTFQCYVNGSSGINYVVQTSTNLASSNWVSLATNVLPFSFVDTNVINYSQRFYRAVSSP
jgi:hypothetical protein